MGLFDKFKKKNELLDNEQNEERHSIWDCLINLRRKMNY